MECQLCGGSLEFLGRLGNLAHFVCRNCGMMFNRPCENELEITTLTKKGDLLCQNNNKKA